jgi:crotonobetaine/carnitine-CoA ligase
MIAVVAKPGHSLDPGELTCHLTERLPYYCVPRYVRIMQALPHTSSNKITKVDIRKQGVTADTWDREAAGIILKKERLKN